jgi:nicotinamidase-related amidase
VSDGHDAYLEGYSVGRAFADLGAGKAALLVIDMQRGFVDAGGAAAVDGAAALIGPINRLVQATRASGAPVVWVRTDYTPPLGGLTAWRSRRVREERCLWRDDPSSELADGLDGPAEGDLEVVKHTYDAFAHTPLEWMLRAHGVDRVVITGVTTEACCDTAARSAYCRGLRPVVVSDATAAAFGPEVHEATLRVLERYFARVVTTAEAVTELAAPRRSEWSPRGESNP